MKLEALKELAAKVERGEWDHSPNGVARQVFPYKSASIDDLGLTAVEAFKGSLDAAKSLHDAVLPGWAVEFVSRPFGVRPHRTHIMLTDDHTGWGNGKRVNASNDDAARAWLLAILRALIAQEEGK